VLCQAFSIFYQSEDVLVTIWPMTSSFTNSTRFLLTIIQSQFLKFLQLFNWTGWGTHNDIHISSGLYHLGNNGCMWFNGVEATSLEFGRCW
jgi:hypothetical protein